jgi:hypothetical protein
MAYRNGRRRRKAPGATTRGGWGHDHQRRRAAIAPVVNAGKATCARCGQPIHAGEELHLDHTDTRDGYLGVSHATCNLRDGANKTNARRRPDPYVQQPYRWSQRWSTTLRLAPSTSTADATPKSTSATANGSHSTDAPVFGNDA